VALARSRAILEGGAASSTKSAATDVVPPDSDSLGPMASSGRQYKSVIELSAQVSDVARREAGLMDNLTETVAVLLREDADLATLVGVFAEGIAQAISLSPSQDERDQTATAVFALLFERIYGLGANVRY